MAYPTPVRAEARKMWLQGYSFEKIAHQLHIGQWQTIAAWRDKEHWEAEVEIIQSKAHHQQIQQEADELAELTAVQLEQLRELQRHINAQLQKPELTPLEISMLVSAMDKVVKNQRLILGATTSRREITEQVLILSQRVEHIEDSRVREALNQLLKQLAEMPDEDLGRFVSELNTGLTIHSMSDDELDAALSRVEQELHASSTAYH